ncbi:MAG: 5-bromo-4-chloroindolyl phosphate hydrolysis family protein [Leptospiraceae bacterium]|nr:5-bromo-4-chloroindolyl phosphate hydrolysis family protein [Leptospiraceae bacterium]MCP5502014.1 5-bromo-4-chloroindolyl phosphate hydrolysis family protein [Leptospiraceae bacterium]
MPENEKEQEEKAWARRAHLSLLLAYPLLFVLLIKGVAFPFVISMLVSMFFPIYIWIAKGGKSELVKAHAQEATFLQAFMALLGFAAGQLWGGSGVTDNILATFSYFGLSLYHLGSVITGSIKASYKKFFNYPLSIFRFFRSRRKDKEEEERILKKVDAHTAKMYKEVMANGEKQLSEIRDISKKIVDPGIKRKVEEITGLIEQIFENFKQDPADIKMSRQFLSYYLDTTMKILRQYNNLSQQKVVSKELTESLQKVDRLLDSLKEAFEKHYAKLLSNDIMDLDTEITVMEKTMKMEGM